MDLSVFSIVISIATGLITIGTVIWKGGKLQQQVQDLVKRHDVCPIGIVQQDIAGIKKQNEIFWAIVVPHSAKEIHSPEHKRRDDLVDKLVQQSINWDELVELEPMLCMEANNGVVEKRLPAALLLTRVQILLMRGP